MRRTFARRSRPPSSTVLVKDQRRSSVDGVALARKLSRSNPNVSLILLSEDETLDFRMAALSAGVFDFMTKSFELSTLEEHLLDAVRRTFDGDRLRGSGAPPAAPASLRDPVADVLVGECLSMLEARERVRAAQASQVPVLLSGEAGTEKLAVARLLHELSERRDEPFVVVNTAQASQAPRGALDALGGSLFFTDVGSLDTLLSAELLELLSSISPSTQRPRIIAGLNQPVSSSWLDGALARAFEAARSIEVVLPPLRERGRDVVLLAEHFAEQGRLARGDASLRITGAAVDALSRYGWPGNVDELRFAVQHAASLCTDSVIHVADLPPGISLSLTASADEHGTRLQVQSLEDMELAYIQRVLDAVGGNKASAARLLGVDRTTLYRKLQRQEHGAPASAGLSSAAPSSAGLSSASPSSAPASGTSATESASSASSSVPSSEQPPASRRIRK
jgi:two-component system, NtrC family, response regulator AtoC